MKKIVLASNNKHKIREFKEILDNVEIITLNDIGYLDEIEETGNTSFENALLKAQTVSEFLKEQNLEYDVIADDSGLFCIGIDLEPGIYSARYAGLHGDDAANRRKLLDNLKDKNRDAYFSCTIVLYHIDGTYEYKEGKTYGKIIDSEKGDTSFGYDCIFLSDDLGKTFGEASSEEKNKVSHRSRAISQIKEIISRDIIYETEEEFLKNYNPEDFDRLSMTADILVCSVSSEESNNYRKTDKKKMSILLIKRNNYPFKDKWCLPGGFIGINENLDDAPGRILNNETNLTDIYLEQLYTFGKVNRDPRMRIVSTSYIALIDKNKVRNSLNSNASWFDIVCYKDIDNVVEITLSNGIDIVNFKILKILKEKTTDRYSFEIIENNDLAFDHPCVILAGIERLKNKVSYTDIVFNMMPELFTLSELQQVYEVILGKKLLDPAFRRIVADKVVKTNKMKTGGGHRPSYLFKYKSNKSKILDKHEQM